MRDALIATLYAACVAVINLQDWLRDPCLVGMRLLFAPMPIDSSYSDVVLGLIAEPLPPEL